MERKLTAILYADVVGYSRLTGADEEGTVRSLKDHLGTFIDEIEKKGGRVVNTAGDAVLAEFASVVTALNCAVAAQREFAERDKDVPDERRLQFRIGVNLGDVMADGEEIYGDGVNVAARLEALGDPGGVCVSRTVFNHVKGKVELGFEYLGEKKVKNIAEPVETYRVLLDPEKAGQVIGQKKPQAPRSPARWQWAAVAAAVLVVAAGSLALWLRPWAPDMERASVDRMALPLPEQPSVAVLPFDNMSGDPAVDYLADGLTEEIITTISKVPDLLVIARNSTFTYKDKAVSVKQVAEEQGVRYVLEGSVQRSGDRIRVNAQLIDAIKGTHVWAERYDRDLTDLFALQDDITENIMVAMQVELTEGEQARLRHARAPSAKAFEYHQKARAIYRRFTKENNHKARELAEKATEIAPTYPLAWQLLGLTHLIDARFGWSESRSESMDKATEFTEKALAIDPENPAALSSLASIRLYRRQHDQAVAYAQKAMDLSPNHATVVVNLGHILSYSGRPKEAIPLIRKAMRLSPYYPAWYVATLGLATMMTGDFDESIAANEEAVQRKTLLTFAYSRLAGMHAEKGDMEKARSYAGDLMKIKPKFNLESWAKALPYKNPADLEREFAMLRKAGLPEKPPLVLPDKPSIVVLPFDNLTGDAEQEYIVDGFTETIIGTLSRLPELIVIARNSSFTFKGKPTRVEDVARELGVRYVLEGSIQRSGDRIRITVQLIDATTGHHLWSRRYDRDIADFFALQDEIAFKTAVALEVKLTEGELARVSSSTTDNLEAWTYFLQSLAEYRKLSKEGRAQSRELAQKAVAIDPEFSGAWLMIGWTQLDDGRYARGDNRETALRQATETAERIAALSPDLPGLHNFLGSIHLSRKEYERAIAEKRRAIELSPSNANYLASTGRALYYMGEYDEAISMMKRARRFHPRNPTWHLVILAGSHIFKGEYDQAIAASQEGLQRAESPFMTAYHRVLLAFAYAEQGRIDAALAEVEKARAVAPIWTIEFVQKRTEFRDPAAHARILGALRKAGMPESKDKK